MRNRWRNRAQASDQARTTRLVPPIVAAVIVAALGGGGIGAALTAAGGHAVVPVPASSPSSTSPPGVAPTSSAPSAPAAAPVRTGFVRTANALPGLARAASLGPAPGSTTLTIDVGLAQPDAAGEQALRRALYTPGDPLYHQFLSPAQFAARFAVPAATVSATERWLESGGLRVGYVSNTGNLISARGTTAQIGALMQTSFGDYRVGPITFVANRQPPAVPAALPVTTVVGLNTLERMWTESQVAKLDGAVRAGSPRAAFPPALLPPVASPTQYTGELVPQDLWGVYDLPCSGDTILTGCDAGQGQTAGVFGTGYSNGVVTNLRAWEQRVGLPQAPVRVVQEQAVGGTPNDNDLLGEVEWNLDTQALTGMAPMLSRLDLYFASTPFDSDIAVMFSAWAGDPNGPDQMNASFGECESDPAAAVYPNLPPLPNVGQGLLGNELQYMGDASLAQAVIEGRTLFTASGDSGGSCPAVILPVLAAGNGLTPEAAVTDQWYPCASIYATCVGGTVVTTDGTTNPGATGAPQGDQVSQVSRQSEVSWMYTGGGPAFDIPEPAYQQGVANITQPCTSPLDDHDNPISPGTVCRGVPDLAAMSGSGTVDQLFVGGANSYYTTEDMMPAGVGGTSLSSPLTAGMWAVIQAADPLTRRAPQAVLPEGNLGFANETIYAVGTGVLGNAAADFTDITLGETPAGNGSQQPGPGWDYTSGWGALDVFNFIRDVDHNPAAVPTNPTFARQPADQPVSVCGVGDTLELSSPGGNAYDPSLSVEPPYSNVAQLDITAASITVDPATSSLTVRIGGPNLSTAGPPDALDGYTFYATWTYNGTTYFAAAAVDQPQSTPAVPGLIGSVPVPVSPPVRQVTYGDGVLDSVTPTFAHVDQGTFGNGTFTITVPLANVGDPPVSQTPGSGGVLQFPLVFDTLPNGVLVPFALDEAAADPRGVQLVLGPC
jgi:hypothetical protein